MAAQAQNASYKVSIDGNQLEVELLGEWRIENAVPSLEPIERACTEGKEPRLTFKTDSLGRWDSSILVFLLKCRDYVRGAEGDFDLESLPEEMQRLLRLSLAVPEAEADQDAGKGTGFFRTLGKFTLDFSAGFREMLHFTGQTTLGLVAFMRGKAQMRWQDFWFLMQQVGASALPIVALISFLVGLIIAFLGAVVLVKFGAAFAVSYIVGYGMLREMGAIMTGIIMAGRTGSAFAAQIGSMKASEEIDALKTLGINPIEFLVVPRVITLILMMPLLTVFANVIGIFGGYLVSSTMLDIFAEQYITTMVRVVGQKDFFLGVFKGGVYGVIIAISGCLRGFQAGRSADAVGTATTSAVVTGITLIIFANALIDWLAAFLNI